MRCLTKRNGTILRSITERIRTGRRTPEETLREGLRMLLPMPETAKDRLMAAGSPSIIRALLRMFPVNRLPAAFRHSPVIIPVVRERALFAALDPGFGIPAVPAALFPERVERAPAEQAVELLFRNASVTGKVLACTVLHESILFFLHLSSSPFRRDPACPPPYRSARCRLPPQCCSRLSCPWRQWQGCHTAGTPGGSAPCSQPHLQSPRAQR